VDCSCSVTGAIIRTCSLAGSTAFELGVNGVLIVPGTVPLAGDIAFACTVSDATLRKNVDYLSGTVTATSTVAANLGVTYQVSGTIAGALNVSAGVSSTKSFSGSLAPTMAVVANLGRVSQLAGSVGFEMDVSAVPNATHQLAGSVATAAVVAGNLEKWTLINPALFVILKKRAR
ncbi:MAG: hypothetical protein ACXABF_16310, partial [Candidatus Thorarchaeota archaeon]